MLDSEADVNIEGQPPIEADVEDHQPDEGEIVITLEGEEPEVDLDADPEISEEEYEALGDKGRAAIRKLKDALKNQRGKRIEAKAEARAVKARLAEIEAATKPKEDDALGPRPVIADYNFNDDLHADALLAWDAKKRALDAKKAEEGKAQNEAAEAYQAKLNRYHAERSKVGVDDDAQARVVSALTPQQQSALMDASLDPAKVVAALAKTPKVLAELSGIKEIHKFAYRLAQIEGKIQVNAKTPPPPETKLRGGGAPASGSLSSQLEAAEKRADATGDRTDVYRIKAAMRKAGVKS